MKPDDKFRARYLDMQEIVAKVRVELAKQVRALDVVGTWLVQLGPAHAHAPRGLHEMIRSQCARIERQAADVRAKIEELVEGCRGFGPGSGDAPERPGAPEADQGSMA